VKSFLVQDFVTIRGLGTQTITQGRNGWLELPDVLNAAAWLEVREIGAGGGTLTMGYQTAPEADDSLFVALGGPTVTMPFTPTQGVTVTPLLKDLLGNGNLASPFTALSTAAPLLGWFRWQIAGTGSSTWDITFRLYLAAHCLTPGQGRTEPQYLR
jgi:hypothetical protein